MTMVLKEKVLDSETHKQMQSWKECIKPLVILTGHFSKKTWMKKICGEAFLARTMFAARATYHTAMQAMY
jgi:hypothetical protein